MAATMSVATLVASMSSLSLAQIPKIPQSLTHCSSSFAIKNVRSSALANSKFSIVCSSSAVDELEDLLEENSFSNENYPPFASIKIHGTGRRKTAIARVGLMEGEGNIIVNGLPLNEYFQNQTLLIQAVRSPLSSLGYETKYDVIVKAHGGGLSAQSQAMVLGIARALCETNPANRPPLKSQGMLTRDSRAVERKKYGLKGARKAPQFSKR